jgi:hypothetical protein
MSDESKIRDVAEVVKGIAEAVPVYQDALQPAAKEIGTALQTLAKTIHIVLAPISALVWGYEQIRDFVSTKVAEKLKDVPPENIATPKPNVAGPALEALKYTGHEETLREMYANLLAASMDTRTAKGAHPSFVVIIRQLTPDEARILRLFIQEERAFPLIDIIGRMKDGGKKDLLLHFSLLGWDAGCEFPDMGPIYIDNLCRLGLVKIPEDAFYFSSGVYDQIESHALVKSAKEYIEKPGVYKAVVVRKVLLLTELGKQFLRVCVVTHEKKDFQKGIRPFYGIEDAINSIPSS